jgi:hypothetical protein
MIREELDGRRSFQTDGFASTGAEAPERVLRTRRFRIKGPESHARVSPEGLGGLRRVRLRSDVSEETWHPEMPKNSVEFIELPKQPGERFRTRWLAERAVDRAVPEGTVTSPK